MKLKHLLLAGVAAGAANMAMATTGTITFNGQVVADSCKVTVDGTTGTVVTLPTVKTSDLSSDGAVAGKTPFTLYIKECGDAVVARGITLSLTDPNNFDGTNNNLLKNKLTSSQATNVGIQLADESSSSTDINFNGNPNTRDITGANITNGEATLPLSASYKSTSVAGATPGAVTSELTWTITYK